MIWITDDDSNMLLAQAPGSNVIPIADPRPDRNGVYVSWGVDFGPSGIETSGSSETGPGVIARLTLLPRSEGVSTLTLSDVLVIDDASERISLKSVQSATISVSQPCANASMTSPTPTTGGGTPEPDPAADARERGEGTVRVAGAPAAGFQLQRSSGTAWSPASLAVIGVSLVGLGGSSLLICGRRQRVRR
jgi:hypothetical protein